MRNFKRMRKPMTQLDKAKAELKPLGKGDSLAHSVKIDKRAAMYAAAAQLGIKISADELKFKIGHFQVTRIS
jgi:ribosomal protein L32E